jgi:hypothetical protein
MVSVCMAEVPRCCCLAATCTRGPRGCVGLGWDDRGPVGLRLRTASDGPHSLRLTDCRTLAACLSYFESCQNQAGSFMLVLCAQCMGTLVSIHVHVNPAVVVRLTASARGIAAALQGGKDGEYVLTVMFRGQPTHHKIGESDCSLSDEFPIHKRYSPRSSRVTVSDHREMIRQRSSCRIGSFD